MTRIDVEAMDIVKGRTQRPAAVARLVQLVPPARVDLVDEAMSRIGRRRADSDLDWPPLWLAYELAWRVKRAHAGDVPLRGEAGEVIDVAAYVDSVGRHRRVYRLHTDGVFVGEFKTSAELGRKVDLATLVEDDRPPALA
jgi:hypothetical protein